MKIFQIKRAHPSHVLFEKKTKVIGVLPINKAKKGVIHNSSHLTRFSAFFYTDLLHDHVSFSNLGNKTN
jgi:hypothetical protein